MEKEELALIQDINYYTRLLIKRCGCKCIRIIANEYLQIKYHPDEKKQNNMVTRLILHQQTRFRKT